MLSDVIIIIIIILYLPSDFRVALTANVSEHFNNATAQTRPQHRELRALLTITVTMQETGPMVYSPYPRRLECLTISRCHCKGSIFSSVILRP